MNEHRRLCEIRWELDDILRKRRDAQARTRAYVAEQAEARDLATRERAQRLADKWAKKSGSLITREDELSAIYRRLDAELRRQWEESR